MRLLKISAAIALMAGSFGLTSAADAQRYDGRHRMERSEHRGDYRRDRVRRDDRRYHRPSRHEARRRNAWRSARHCRMEWRHHRRIRVCR